MKLPRFSFVCRHTICDAARPERGEANGERENDDLGAFIRREQLHRHVNRLMNDLI